MYLIFLTNIFDIVYLERKQPVKIIYFTLQVQPVNIGPCNLTKTPQNNSNILWTWNKHTNYARTYITVQI
jgi:hypothetical protein